MNITNHKVHMRASCLNIINFKKNTLPYKIKNIALDDARADTVILRSASVDIKDARLISGWRSRTYKSFFTWIKPEPSDVMQWLESYQEDPSDILFIVESPHGCPIGQMAIYNICFENRTAEFGRILRGQQGGARGAMTNAAFALLNWGFSIIEFDIIHLEVFAHNQRAMKLYQQLGFKRCCTLRYVKATTDNGDIKWCESKLVHRGDDENWEFCEVYRMELSEKEFKKVLPKRAIFFPA